MVSVSDAHKPECVTVWLDRVDYQAAVSNQRALALARANGTICDMLLLLEHPHVFTLGRRGQLSDVLIDEAGLAKIGASVHHVDRGGQVTYHGPGQLIGYPIVHLGDWGGGPLAYVRTIEQVLIATLHDFGISAKLKNGLTGVWVGQEKIAAIGVKIGLGVTTHGFSLNVDPDLSYYSHIIPCGMPTGRITSMANLLDRSVQISEVYPKVVEHFGNHFGFLMANGSWKSLEQTTEPLAGHF